VPVGDVHLHLLVAELDEAGHRQRLPRAERERRRPHDIVLGVCVAQLALGGAGLGTQALAGRLADAEGQAREREAAEQVVPVGVGRQQPARLEAGLAQQRRQQLELVREVRRVDDERLVPDAQRGRGRLPEPARDDDDVAVDADCAHAFPAPRRRRAAWRRRAGS
jgi:hypothetical protein